MFKKILVLASLFAFLCANAYGGTVTISSAKHTTWGNKRVTMATVALSGAYSSTAFNLTAAKLGMNKIEKIVFMPYDYSAAKYVPQVGASTYVILYANKYNSNKPSITAPVASDTFNVYTKAIAAADAETCNVIIKPVFGQIAKLIAPGIGPAEISDAMLHRAWTYADSSTYAGVVDDSVGNISEIGGGYKGGDTLWWDYNGTSRVSRLAYTGNVMGNQGTLYVPAGGGHYLQVVRLPSGGAASSIVRLGYWPLYFKPSAGLDDKFQADITGNTTATNGGLVDTTYSSLIQYNAVESVIATGTSVSLTYYVIAIGN